MDITLLIAILSALAALLAAVYARWASVEAKRSNELSLLTNKIEIYKEFLALKYAVQQKAETLTYEDTSKFYLPHLYSEFCFQKKVHEKIVEFFDVCFEIAQKSEDRTTQRSLLERVRTISKDAEDMIKRELKVAMKKRSWIL